MISNNKIFFVGHLTKDDIVLNNGDTKFNSLGGATLYCAAGAKIFNANVGIVSVVGESYDFSKLEELSLKYNVDIQCVHKKKLHGIDIWVLYDSNNEHYYIKKYYSSGFDEFSPSYNMLPQKELKQNNFFHLTPMPVEIQQEHLNKLSKNKCHISLDPHQESCIAEKLCVWENVLNKIDIFFPSEIEFSSLTQINKPYHNLKELKRFCDYYNIKKTVLKLGENGALYYEAKESCVYFIKAISKKAIDCTGAGDAFAGGVISSYINNSDIIRSIICGAIASSYAVETSNIEELFACSKSDVEKRRGQANVFKICI